MRKKLINSQMTNLETYRMIESEMIDLALSVFYIKDLPEEINMYYLYNSLLYNGSIAFFYDDVMKTVLALPYTTIGRLNIYNEPRKIMVRAVNGRFYRSLNEGEFVIMYDNLSRRSIIPKIRQKAERIAFYIRTEDINGFQQRTPRIWKTSSEQKRTVEDIMDQLESFREAILTYDGIDINSLQGVVAPAPYVIDKIDDHINMLWNDFYRLVGISNVQFQKRERMITDEMHSSMGGTVASRYNRFLSRNEAIEKINKKWGTNMKLYYYDGIPETDNVVGENDKEVENYDVF